MTTNSSPPVKKRSVCHRRDAGRHGSHPLMVQLWMTIMVATVLIQSACLPLCVAFIVPHPRSSHRHHFIHHGDRDHSVALLFQQRRGFGIQNVVENKDPVGLFHKDVVLDPTHSETKNNFHHQMIKFMFMTILTVLTPLQVIVDFPPVMMMLPQQQNQQSAHVVHNNQYHFIQQQSMQAWAMTEQQLLINDVWKEVTRQYVDPTYNGLGEEGWKKERLKALKRVEDYGPDDMDKVYAEIRTMLQRLGDPYTRFLTPDQYESLTLNTLGSSSSSTRRGGIGVQLLVNQQGQVVIGNLFPKGPAERAGIQPGDILAMVDDVNFLTGDATAEVVAAKLRGALGTPVTISVQRGGQEGSSGRTMITQELTREALTADRVQFSTFVTSSSNPQQQQRQQQNLRVGVLKVSSFSQDTVTQVQKVLEEEEARSSDVLVIDLRGNVGGYMPAGVNMAKLFLQPRQRVITEVDKTERATIYINDGIAGNVETPIYILVDGKTASASEIFVAALQDNNRATVVGSTRTFGKGRIQNVQLLEGGSGIAVTKAKYMTPKGHDLHGIGILPDRSPGGSCERSDSAASCLSGMML